MASTDFLRFSAVAYLAFAGLLSFAPTETLLAQDEKPVTENEAADEELLLLKKRLKSPQSTIDTFIKAMDASDSNTALSCLDLSNLPEEIKDAKGNTYAVKLYRVLKNTSVWDGDLEKISDYPQFEPPYVIADSEYGQLIQLFPNKTGMWKFSRTTLETVDQWLAEKVYQPGDPTVETAETTAISPAMWVESQFPTSLRHTTFLIEDYKWICLLLLMVAGFIVGRFTKFLLDLLTDFWLNVSQTSVDSRPKQELWTPVGMLAHVGTWYLGASLIDLPASAMVVLLQGLKFLTVVSAVWTAFRGINLLSNYLEKRAARTPSRYDDSLVPLISNALKLASVLAGTILFVDVFQLDWKAVIGGFGLGGVALAIASKDMIGNIFGSITVLTDRPFEIGDWVIIDGNVEGTVESVGMRSSRIRTFHNSQIVVPNSILTTAIVDNMGRRRARRMKTYLQVKYDTPVEKLEMFCAGIRQLVQNNPYTVKENFHVYVNQFNASSIDILLYLFLECNDWSTELREKHCLMMDIMKLAEKIDVGFAFPTRTIEMAQPQLASPGNLVDGTPKSLQEIGTTARELADEISKSRN